MPISGLWENGKGGTGLPGIKPSPVSDLAPHRVSWAAGIGPLSLQPTLAPKHCRVWPTRLQPWALHQDMGPGIHSNVCKRQGALLNPCSSSLAPQLIFTCPSVWMVPALFLKTLFSNHRIPGMFPIIWHPKSQGLQRKYSSQWQPVLWVYQKLSTEIWHQDVKPLQNRWTSNRVRLFHNVQLSCCLRSQA